jgi:RNA polymerase sigma factor (sigma-70 family)
MPSTPLANVVQHIRQLATPPGIPEPTDPALLERFLHGHDQDAFAALVRRHGPLVLRVCRRVLRGEHDAEDAFQATFLALARRGGSIRKAKSLASWLHGVAYRMAMYSKRTAARRQNHEQRARTAAPADPAREAAWREVQQLLDAEIQRLPERLRTPFLLCCVEGLGRAEAARQLGVKVGTIWSRLAEARRQLQQRLRRRGIELSAVLGAAALAEGTARAALAAELVRRTTRAATAWVSGARAVGEVSADVLALVHGGTRGMAAGKVKLGAVLLLLAGMAAAGAGFAMQQVRPAKHDPVPSDTGSGPAAVAPQDNRPPTRTDRYGEPLPPDALARLGTRRFRHGELATLVQFAPDGKTLISGGYDALRLWDVATGRSLGTLANEYQPGAGILSPAGNYVLTVQAGDTSQRPRLWDVATGRLTREFADEHPFAGACFSADGRALATVGSSQHHHPRCVPYIDMIALWDIATGHRVRAWTGHQDGVLCARFTADGKTLITGGGDKTIRFWDVETGKEVRPALANDRPVGHLVLSPDGKLLAVVGLKRKFEGGEHFPSALAWNAGNRIRVWDVAAGREVQSFTVPYPKQTVVSGVTGVAFTPDGKRLVTGGVDQFARLWDVATGKEVRRYDMGHAGVLSVALSPDGKTLAGLPGGRAVRIFDLATGKERTPAKGARADVRCVAVTPDNSTVLTAAGGDAALSLWRLPAGEEGGRLQGHDQPVAAIAAAGDGRTLYSFGYGDRRIVVWDLRTRKAVRRLPQPAALKSAPPIIAALAPDGKTLALAVPGGEVVCLIDATTGREVRQINRPQTAIEGVAFTADGHTLAVFPREHSVELWDLADGRKRREFVPPGAMRLRGAVQPVGLGATALSPNGRLLAYVRVNGAPAVCELATGKPVHAGPAVPRGISVFAFSPDGRMLAWGGGEDHVVHLMEVATGQERRRLVGHEGRVGALAFSADGKLLVSGSADTTALVWDLTGRLDGAGVKRPLSSRDLDRCWADLGAADAGRGYAGVRALAAGPGEAVPYLEKKLLPVAPVDKQVVVRLIADLDQSRFAGRERAAADLTRLGEGVVPALRRALAERPKAEARRRLTIVLGKLAPPEWEPTLEQRRTLRAVEALEHMSSPAARRLLTHLARGLSGARLTREATAALGRLQKRVLPGPSAPVPHPAASKTAPAAPSGR